LRKSNFVLNFYFNFLPKIELYNHLGPILKKSKIPDLAQLRLAYAKKLNEGGSELPAIKEFNIRNSPDRPLAGSPSRLGVHLQTSSSSSSLSDVTSKYGFNIKENGRKGLQFVFHPQPHINMYLPPSHRWIKGVHFSENLRGRLDQKCGGGGHFFKNFTKKMTFFHHKNAQKFYLCSKMRFLPKMPFFSHFLPKNAIFSQFFISGRKFVGGSDLHVRVH
jgi:hypothetical protein